MDEGNLLHRTSLLFLYMRNNSVLLGTIEWKIERETEVLFRVFTNKRGKISKNEKKYQNRGILLIKMNHMI